MGLFGGQTKTDVRVEPQAPIEPEEPLEERIPLPKPRNNTVIAKGLTVTGSIHGEGVVQVEGNVEGELDLKGSVIVTTTGLIKGPITADVVRVAGNVEGSVIAHDHLRLEKSGTLVGDVTTASLVVEDGGRLNGRSTMIKAEKPPLDSTHTPPVEELQFGSNYKLGEDGEEAEKAEKGEKAEKVL